MSAPGRPYRIVIANQHGENRGDEAAMRAMLASLTRELGDVEFTLLYQFRDRSLRLSFREPVEALPIIIPPLEALGLVAFGAARTLVPPPHRLLGPTAEAMIRAYERADLVISAPGGPYFGDLYQNHELAHWYFVWLAKVYRKPTFLYATSAGPFASRWMNPIRRRLYRKFDVLCVREDLSAAHLRGLLGPEPTIHVTADSALQQSFDPMPREAYFRDARQSLGSKFLVAVSLNDYAYPGASDPAAHKRAYDDTMIEVLRHLASQRDCHFLLLPQLYGRAHRDAPYLERMMGRMQGGTAEVVDESLDSDTQRRLFAMCDLHVASRYHPAIFGQSSYVPGLCIYYEHKALGFMKQLGLERFAFDIRKLETSRLCQAIDELLTEREALVAALRSRVPAVREAAGQTTRLAVDLLRSSTAGHR